MTTHSLLLSPDDLSTEERRQRDARRRKVASDYLSYLLAQAAFEGGGYRAALERLAHAQSSGDARKIESARRHVTIQTRAYAASVSKAAKMARTYVQNALEHWCPADDIAGTGLTQAELRELCEVSGWPANAAR